MHNGGIAEFSKIKRKLQHMLPDNIYAVPQGNTGGLSCAIIHMTPVSDLTRRFGMGICSILVNGGVFFC